MAPRLIPERTIDAWMAHELLAVDSEAMVWLPTPHRQAKDQPWDLSVDAFGPPAKLLVYETKALEEGPGVTIRIDQLLTLLELWLRHGYFFYALPALSANEVQKASSNGPAGRAALRREPESVGDWLRILTPVEILWALSARSRGALRRQLDEAVRNGASEIRATARIRTGALTGFPSLHDHLDAARGCLQGRLIEVGDIGPTVGHLLSPAQRIRVLGSAVAGLLTQRFEEPPTSEALLDRTNMMAPSVAGALVSAERSDVARHLLTTTWVTMRVS